MDQPDEGILQNNASLQNNCSDLNPQDKIMMEQVQLQPLSQHQKKNLEQQQ
jgi:hypothetical protein